MIKCWECGKEILKGLKVQYWDGEKIRIRKVCEECHPKLKRDSYGFVEVEKIAERQLNLKVDKKSLERKTVKELVEIARNMGIDWYMTRSRSNDGNDIYTDYVTVSKDKLIDRIINKRSFDIYKGGF